MSADWYRKQAGPTALLAEEVAKVVYQPGWVSARYRALGSCTYPAVGRIFRSSSSSPHPAVSFTDGVDSCTHPVVGNFGSQPLTAHYSPRDVPACRSASLFRCGSWRTAVWPSALRLACGSWRTPLWLSALRLAC